MTRDSLKRTMKDAAQTAQEAGSDALKLAKAEAASAAVTAAKSIRAEAEARADEGKAHVSREGVKLTNALRERARTADFEVERHLLNAVAGSVAEMSEDLRTRSISSLIDETERFARRHPGAFVAGAAIAGFALARFARASGRGGESSVTDYPLPVPVAPADVMAVHSASVNDPARRETEMQS